MTDWARHWEEFPLRFSRHDHLRQVGKTVAGEPISAGQFETLLDAIDRGLKLTPDDALLDLCCGNGLVTSRLAARCGETLGVDASAALIRVAEEDHARPNLRYRRLSALELPRLSTSSGGPFTKVLIYEALQHFAPRDLAALLAGIAGVAAPGARLFVGSIPDRARRSRFHDTPRRRLVATLKRLAGRDAIGTWWRRETVLGAVESTGWSGTLLDQPRALHTAHYRFDLLAVRAGAGGRGAGAP
ncbi:MAG TPA: class I SAM-dependent methyltransferase [Verrucomicrobiae bacterium]|nr:class I SAM-dependent methyltransferase [Verrucomicrobiae bacterium]